MALKPAASNAANFTIFFSFTEKEEKTFFSKKALDKKYISETMYEVGGRNKFL